MNEIWERVLANSFSGIHKSKIICSEGNVIIKDLEKRVWYNHSLLHLISVHLFNVYLCFELLLFYFSHALSLPSKLCVSSTMVPQPRIPVLRNICFATQPEDRKGCNFCQTGSFRPFSYVYMYNIRTQPTKNFLPPHVRENREGGGYTVPNAGAQCWNF